MSFGNHNLNITLDTREHLGSVSLTDSDKYAARQLGIAGEEGPVGPEGLPGIRWQGGWNDTQIYNVQDGVKYQGSVYIYINSSSTSGFLPTDTTYWDIFVEKGDTGDHGTPGTDSSIVAEYTQEPTGFHNRNDSIITYNEASRQLSISPTIDNYTVMVNGSLYTKTVTDAIIWTDVEGLHYFYFNPLGVIQTTQSFHGFKNIASISFIYWDATNKVILHTGEERHGMIMDWKTYEYLHNTEGSKYGTGLDITFTVGDGSLDSDNTIELTNGVIWNGDLDHHITHGISGGYFTQPLTPIAQLPVWNRSGETNWRKMTATDYPFAYTDNIGPLYNQKNGLNWLVTQVPDNNYCVFWVVATNDVNNPVVIIMGQHHAITITETIRLNQLNNVDFGLLPIQETKILYRLVIRHKSLYTSITRAHIAEVTDLRLTVDKATIDESDNVANGDKSYIHTQSVASDMWTFTHNLEKHPSVTVIDSAGSMVVGDINYNDINSITITFSAAFTGTVYLN